MSDEIIDAGFKDILVGTELIRSLGVPAYEFDNPIQFSKLKEVAEFLNEHPDPMYIINNLQRKSVEKPLDFLVGFARLSKQKSDLKNKLDELDKELNYYL